ncbi:MAG TPA: hypothetical protein VF780_08070 [Nitrosospira sp.]
MEYSEQLIQQVWEKARVTTDINADQWREDECGAWIARQHYRDTGSSFGWKIVNVSAGGPDTPENLRPFHHRNSYDTGGQRAQCHVTADRTGLPPFEHSSQLRNRSV